MLVKDVMTSDPHIANPEQSLQEIAAKMAEDDIGFVPVGENDRLVGTLTDRDMAIRGFSEGMDGTYLVRDVMSREVKYCFADEDTLDVMRNMAELQIRRLPVVNEDKRLVGVVSFADLARKDDPEYAGRALSEITAPGGAHSQTADL